MTDEFLSLGLEADRYLKVVRLVEQFESEIEAVLREFDQQMVDVQPDLFDPSTDVDMNTNRTPSSGLALHRINHPMDGPRAPEDDRRLNVHLYWMPPAEYGRIDIDGALRGFGYKIKYGEQEADDRVVEQTRAGEWSIETAGNPYGSNTVFYRHVSSLGEIEETSEVLVDHFSTFGDEYAAGAGER